MALDALATLVVIFYFLLITCVGVWAGRKLHFGDSRQKRTYTYRLNRSKYRKERHREEQLFLLRLFLCERKLTILLGFATVTGKMLRSIRRRSTKHCSIYLSLATWVGGGYLNAAAEVVYTSGIIWCYAPLGYAVSLLLGGGLFASKMRSTDSFTMLDPFQRRFGKWVVLLPIVPALCGELCWSAAILTALGTAVEVMVGFNSSTVAIVVSSFVALFYTALGGLYSVIYTDIYQIITSAAGLWYCVPFVFRNSAVGTIKGPDADWVGSMDFGDIVVALDFFLMTALGGISWQVYFQRVLSAATELDARVFSYLSAVGCIFLALPPVIMGAAATTANFTQAGYRGPFRLMDEDLHRALPYIMHLLMPRLQAVIGMLAIMTAVMSSFDSSTLSAATMITRNVYQELVRPKAGVKEIATVLRTAVVGFGGVATVMALWVSPNSVYSLWVFSSDLVYVLLFPQLLCLFYLEEISNSYGLLFGFLASGALRALSGEPSMGVPARLRYPFYDEVQGQRFPFRTFCMVINLGLLVLFSKLATYLFQNKVLAPNLDLFNSFPDLHPAELPAEAATEAPTEAPTEVPAEPADEKAETEKSAASCAATNS